MSGQKKARTSATRGVAGTHGSTAAQAYLATLRRFSNDPRVRKAADEAEKSMHDKPAAVRVRH